MSYHTNGVAHGDPLARDVGITDVQEVLAAIDKLAESEFITALLSLTVDELHVLGRLIEKIADAQRKENT